MINLQFLGFPNYEVTECGKVWSHYNNRFLKMAVSTKHHDKYGKYMLSQDGKQRFITAHRLVAFAYLDKPHGRDYVNHIDGDIYNNSISNLEWVTALENNIHSINHVKKPQFIDNENLKLPLRGDYKKRGQGRHNITDEEAVNYCEYMMQGYRGCDIKEMMGISSEIFTHFKHNRLPRYKHIVDKYDFSHLRSQRLTTTSEVIAVCEMLQEGNTVMNTYKVLGLSRSVVRGIASRRNHKEVSKDFVW